MKKILILLIGFAFTQSIQTKEVEVTVANLGDYNFHELLDSVMTFCSTNRCLTPFDDLSISRSCLFALDTKNPSMGVQEVILLPRLA